jgi:hypothetical protein
MNMKQSIKPKSMKDKGFKHKEIGLLRDNKYVGKERWLLIKLLMNLIRSLKG